MMRSSCLNELAAYMVFFILCPKSGMLVKPSIHHPIEREVTGTTGAGAKIECMTR